MEYDIDQLSVAEYAYIQSLRGHKVELHGSVYWIETRRFFYRPVLPFIALNSVVPPCRGYGGYQYAVDNERDANSTINFRIYGNCNAYSIKTQKSEYRRAVRIAEKTFCVKRIDKEQDLKGHGYKLYLSFYNRTKYQYLAKRTRQKFFYKWVETIFICPKSVILGGYREDRLMAVAVCYWIDEFLLYSTFFADTASMKQHIGDLMLHTVRQLAAQQEGIQRILAGMYSGGTGCDRFDLLRGAKIERKPARYVMCPAPASSFLRTFLPAQYRKLTGDF
jgi:hypothetical protein